ncbi:MAG: response regulator [Myxococcales bacterium]|nr:response regulator [Myxococcales bacterium]
MVEDELATRALFTRTLATSADLSVISVDNAEEGKLLARMCEFDVAVLDLVLDDGTGFDVLEELRANRTPECVVLVSAHIDAFRRSVRIEPNLVLLDKPVSSARLLDALDSAAPRHDHFEFTVPEYLQIACMGLHSVRLEVWRRDQLFGSVTILDGQLWSARDARGSGEDAFRRVLELDDATVVCRAPGAVGEDRDISRSWQHVLLDAAKLGDEGARDDAAARPVELSPAESVEDIIEHAARAVRDSRFHDAYAAYSRVLELDGRNGLALVNVARLRRLGFDDEAL